MPPDRTLPALCHAHAGNTKATGNHVTVASEAEPEFWAHVAQHAKIKQQKLSNLLAQW